MTKQRLRTKVLNIAQKRFLSDVEIREMLGARRAEDDVEELNVEKQLKKKEIVYMLQRFVCR